MTPNNPQEQGALEPCEKCGEMPCVGRLGGDVVHFAIRCLHCHYWFVDFDGEEQTRSAWNKRAALPASAPVDGGMVEERVKKELSRCPINGSFANGSLADYFGSIMDALKWAGVCLTALTTAGKAGDHEGLAADLDEIASLISIEHPVSATRIEDAATAITALEAENARLREALGQIELIATGHTGATDREIVNEVHAIAQEQMIRTALATKESGCE